LNVWRAGRRAKIVPMKNVLRAVISLGFLATLICVERRRPLRVKRESKLGRSARNLAMASLSALTIHFVETPVVHPLASLVKRKRWGLLKRLNLPKPVERVAALLLMDYTLYLWHVLVHRHPALWRFHAVHHVDLDVDASTGLRFHFGELAISVPFRALQVLLIGVDRESLTAWQTFLSFCILFHHSNVRVPEKTERLVSLFVVTPRMHGIHHSSDARQGASNWSSGLSVWDFLHGTFRLDVPQEEITVGVRGIEKPEQVTLPKMLEMPFNEPEAVRAYLKTQ